MEVGFEPTKPKQRFYRPPHLTTLELHSIVGREGFEPPMFTLWDQMYSLAQHHHRCCLPKLIDGKCETAPSNFIHYNNNRNNTYLYLSLYSITNTSLFFLLNLVILRFLIRPFSSSILNLFSNK